MMVISIVREVSCDRCFAVARVSAKLSRALCSKLELKYSQKKCGAIAMGFELRLQSCTVLWGILKQLLTCFSAQSYLFAEK